MNIYIIAAISGILVLLCLIFIINQGREYKFEAIRITAAIGLLLSIVFAYSIMSTVGCLLINSLPASDRNQTRNELIKKLRN